MSLSLSTTLTTLTTTSQTASLILSASSTSFVIVHSVVVIDFIPIPSRSPDNTVELVVIGDEVASTDVTAKDRSASPKDSNLHGLQRRHWIREQNNDVSLIDDVRC